VGVKCALKGEDADGWLESVGHRSF
jgi:hypothetical protein